jgi:hypothetical protein
MGSWLMRVLIAFDRMVNVMLGGSQDQTISARSALGKKNGKIIGCFICWILDKIEKDHCSNALKTDERDAENVQKEEEL